MGSQPTGHLAIKLFPTARQFKSFLVPSGQMIKCQIFYTEVLASFFFSRRYKLCPSLNAIIVFRGESQHDVECRMDRKKKKQRHRQERETLSEMGSGNSHERVNTERGKKDGGRFPKAALENKTCQSYRLG